MYFLNSNAKDICNFDHIDLVSIFIASLGHDIAHPGLTNAFQINSQSEYDIFSNVDIKQYNYIRKLIVNMILAIDMAIHGKVMANIQY